jgi:ssDNA-binding Zn-finger/Zn-ribbon topoisomerase 1
MAKSSEGAGNFSLVLKLMSKIALAEGQEKVGARVVCCRHHGQAVIIMKNHHKTLQIKSYGENSCPIEFIRKLLAVHQDQAAAVGACPEC